MTPSNQADRSSAPQLILRDLAMVDAVQVLDVAGPHRLLHEVDGDELWPPESRSPRR